MSLKFIAISGTTDVTENCYLYESGQDIIMVDCGVGFPDSEMFGVDLTIPDFSYVRENVARLKGVVITHGHEDHIGALPFLLKEIKVPIYASKLVAGFIKDKFKDYKMPPPEVRVFDPEKDTLNLGVFKITPFRISHSVPDSAGLCIDTPEGKFFHVPDYKFDWTPVDQRPFAVRRMAILASDGVLGVASDCLGATSPGYTESEKAIEARIEAIAAHARGQIFFTTISSNISRMQQAIRVAQKLGRKVTFIGRSTDAKAKIAKELGFLNYKSDAVVDPKKMEKVPDSQRLYIISGSYGQPGSALYRTAIGEHDFLTIGKDDVVIFSSDPAPPGTRANVDFVVDRLIEAGAEVHYYDLQEDLHVSGHGSQEDIKTLFGLLSPKHFIPIGGTVRHMLAYRQIAQNMGAPTENVFALKAGEIVEFKNGEAFRAGQIAVKSVLVDGLGIGDVGKVVLRDRQVLSQEGIAIALIKIDQAGKKLLEEPEIISRGFVFEKVRQDLLIKAARQLKIQIEKRRIIDRNTVREVTIDFLEKFFYRETGRQPMILPVVVEV